MKIIKFKEQFQNLAVLIKLFQLLWVEFNNKHYSILLENTKTIIIILKVILLEHENRRVLFATF